MTQTEIITLTTNIILSAAIVGFFVGYKLSSGVEGEHQKQIEGYIELVRQFYPKHKVSGHVLYLME